MATMSFGEHIEELRVRLILGLLGLVVGVIIVFLPPLDIAWRVMKSMEAPAKQALEEFYKGEYAKKAQQARDAKAMTPVVQAQIPADKFVDQAHDALPRPPPCPSPARSGGSRSSYRSSSSRPDFIKSVESSTVQIDQSLVSLAVLETLTIYFMVALVAGLVVASPWVFYQIWAFVGAGLYRHERAYVKKFLPFSLGLFLAGVFLCFLFVLPITLRFLLQFNVYLGVAPTLRLSEWMSFATHAAPDLRPILPDAAGHDGAGTAEHFHDRRLPLEAQVRDPDHHDRRRRADSRPGPVQHAPAGDPDDFALRAGNPHDRPREALPASGLEG